MTPLEPQVADTGRYSITETCKLLGVTIKTIIKYTDQGDLKCGIRKANGRKFYTGSEIRKFWKVA